MDRETLEGMRRFFSPTHIAVVGASTKNHWFANVVKNARSIGFEGGIHPINPNAAEVAGIKAFPSIGELPDGLIDFGVIIVNAKLVLKSIEELVRKGSGMSSSSRPAMPSWAVKACRSRRSSRDIAGRTASGSWVRTVSGS